LEKFSAVILAGGKGRRMKSDLSKVLFELLSKPLIDWVMDALKLSGAEDFCTVVGHKRELVLSHLNKRCEFAVQEQQLGTGHAMIVAKPFLQKHKGETVAVMSGDVPLVKAQTLKSAFLQHKQSGASVTILTESLTIPTDTGVL
jgi:bifunctional UDP-N-acetylglucosamine pyrophosphorylase/glucosamine-1-phosphate N-acetyltransferase